MRIESLGTVRKDILHNGHVDYSSALFLVWSGEFKDLLSLLLPDTFLFFLILVFLVRVVS